MASSDWDIASGGDTHIGNSTFEHANVPTEQLTHDTRCQKLDSASSSDYGRQQLLYGTSAPSYSEFDLTKDVSVRGLLNLGLRGAEHALVLGARMSAGVSSVLTDNKQISDNGYQLRLWEDGTWWILTLYRVLAGVETPITNDIKLASGSSGDYKWFHFRLDFILQFNGGAILRVFTNDITTNPIDPGDEPYWGASWEEIVKVYDTSDNVPAYFRVGYGGQIDPGAGSIYEGYIDWNEFWYSD